MPRAHVYRARRGDGHLRRAAQVVASLVAILIGAWSAFTLLRSVPAPTLALTVSPTSRIAGTPLVLRPSLGVEEAVALGGAGTVAVAGATSPTPIASLTKMMSALVVLRAHPLSLGQSGPEISVTSADVATYVAEKAANDSVVAVRVGEQLSELQALEGALIPSGDNIVQMLASWDAGSTAAFVAKMNALAAALGLDHTHYAGPSGVNPATVSTATDQLRLAGVAMENPVFKSIVAIQQVSLPVAGMEYNVNADLGSDGIDGIKTGWVPQGGGCFVFSASHDVGGFPVTVLGAVLGERGGTPVPTALATAKQLVVASERSLRTVRLPAGSAVAKLTSPSGSSVRLVTTSPMSLMAWKGAAVQFAVRVRPALPDAVATGARVGTLTITLGHERQTLVLKSAGQLRGPSLTWRLTHL